MSRADWQVADPEQKPRRLPQSRSPCWWSSLSSQEIRSGGICPDPDEPGCFLIDANTSSGLRKLGAIELGRGDSQSEVTAGTGMPVADEFLSWATSWSDYRRRPKRKDPSQPHDATGGLRASEEILRKLADPKLSNYEKRNCVIEAEVVRFTPQDSEQLKGSLLQFIEQFRNSDDPAELVAVGSAIRKYVAMMHADDLSSLTLLLDADHHVTVPLEIELELTKTLGRWLTVNPPKQAAAEPELADCLYDLAETYLAPRILAREKYGAVALNTVLALLMLQSRHTDVVIERLKGLEVAWFTELVARRACQIRDRISQRELVSVEECYEGLTVVIAELAANCTL